jgi:hypothetical protein
MLWWFGVVLLLLVEMLQVVLVDGSVSPKI